MKKKNFRLKAIFAFLAVLILSCGIGVATALAEPAANVELNISGANLSFDNEIHLMYAIKSNDKNVKLLVWDEPQDEYTVGSQKATVSRQAEQTNINGSMYTTFVFTGVSAKNMTDNYYVRAYIADGEQYGNVFKYSILQYAYNKLGKTGVATTNENLKEVLTTMLDYGAATQKYMGYKTDNLANESFSQVTLTNGTLPDGFSKGLYKLGNSVTISAPLTDADGYAFKKWVNQSNSTVANTAEYVLTVGEENNTYTAQYIEPSQGLEYTSSGDGTCSITGIGSCTDTKIIIHPTSPSGDVVTGIADYAFETLTSLKGIIIPDTVTSIGDEVFSGCTGLTSIIIPESVEYIGSSAFAHCTNLTIYAEVSSQPEEWSSRWNRSNCLVVWGYNTNGSQGLLYSSNGDGTCKVNGIGSCKDKNVIIPTISPDGDMVTGINSSAFWDCDSLTSIEIPNSVQSIDDWAFWDCDSLTSIEIQDSVLSIGNYAFYDCDSLTSVTIGNGVQSIGYEAFYNCDSLTSVTIGNGVQSIGSWAFGYCSSLTSIEIPDSVQSIGNYAFYDCSKLTSIEISDSVQSMGSDAFYGCCKLVEVINYSDLNIAKGSEEHGYVGYYAKQVITDKADSNIIEQGDYIFYNDNEVYYLVGYKGTDTDLVLPDSINGNNYSIYKYAFYNCTQLTNVIIPDSVQSIGDYAFGYCSSLTSVTIGNGVQSIDDWAFWDCDSLTSIEIPDSVQSIGNRAFSSCDSLASIEIPDSVQSIGDYAFGYCSSLTSVTIGNGVQSIDDWAFYECSSLTSVTIGNSVQSIGVGAFAICSSLTSIAVDENNQYYSSIDGNLYNKDKTILIQYAIGKKETSFVTPDSVQSIGVGAFGYCSSLRSVIIGNGVQSIGSDAFYGCDSLTSVTIGNSVQSMDSNAFYGCCKLVEVINYSDLNIAKGSEEHGYVGYYAKQVITDKADSNIIEQGDYIFYNDNEVYYLVGYKGTDTDLVLPDSINGNKYAINQYAFWECNSLTSVTIGNGVQSIDDWAFWDCDSLTSIEIPDSVQSIGNYAFYDCDSLTSVTIGNGVQSIGNRAFSSCDSLASIEIPDSVQSIGDSAFYYCDSLTSVTIGNGVQSIGYEAFCNCDSLTSIEIPDSVQSIGNYAFGACDSLTSVTFADTTTWYYTTTYNHNYTGGTQIDVTNATNNAMYLKNTYYDYYWYKK